MNTGRCHPQPMQNNLASDGTRLIRFRIAGACVSILIAGCGVPIREFQGAAASGDVASLKKYLDSGVDPDYGGVEGKAAFPLHLAAHNGRDKAIELLCRRGATIEARANNSDTALMLAAREGHAAAVKELIKQGARVDAKNVRGNTALHDAARGGHLEVVRLLIDAGANLNAEALPGHAWPRDLRPTPLYHAKAAKHQEVIELLESHGAR